MNSPTTPPTSFRGFYWALGGLVAVFGAVRLACARNDLWLDEIWSLRLVQPLHSSAEILTRVWHDNNHPLNSLWLYLVGPGQPEWVYRLLSWFMGTLSVGLAGLIGRRLFQRLHPDASRAQAAIAGLITATLIGGSYLLIHYSSEARGYAPAVGFAFLAVYALLRATDRPASVWAGVYGLACVLGVLAHLIVVQVLVGGLIWSAVTTLRNWSRWRDRLTHLLCWHLVPWLFLGLYYIGFVRKLQVGGGPQLGLGNVVGALAAFCLGLPGESGPWLALPLFLAAVLVVLVLLARRDLAWAGFYVTAIFVAPLPGLLSSRFVLLYPRYFIVSGALALLLVGYGLARSWNSGRKGRGIGFVALMAFLAGNAVHVARLLQHGRGEYQAALRYLAAQTPTATITIASDFDFRNFTVIDYYRKAVGPDHSVQYYPADQFPPEGPQWILIHRLDETTTPPEVDLAVAGRWHYRQVRVFLHAPLSGWEWYVYRNLDPDVLPPAGR